jgi:diacylglycerol kinase (ATP)
MSKAKIKLIYNPNAGAKRKTLSLRSAHTIEEVKSLFERYLIPIDVVASRSEDHAIKLAKESEKEGYEIVVAAGGDGTVATIAHGLIGTKVALAVLPLGSVMNIARMLAIPNDLELAVALIKIGRRNTIDVGQILKLDGKEVSEPTYFIEQAGIGFDADYRYYLNDILENKKWSSFIHLIKILLPLFGPRIEVSIDGEIKEKKARMVIVSNGPISGLAIEFAPSAKLNDHLLTTSVFTLSKLGLGKFLINLFLRKKTKTSKVKVYKSNSVTINTRDQKMIHADSRVFGTTPAEFKILPQCLSVITGFPSPDNAHIKTRTPIVDR